MEGLDPRIEKLLLQADVDRTGELSTLEIIRVMKLHPEIRIFLFKNADPYDDPAAPAPR